MLKSKKGFTLVELSVVIAVTAIVITMVCIFLVTYQQQSTVIAKSNDAVSDINQFKETVGQWISENDDGSADFTVLSNEIRAGTNRLMFDSGNLTINSGSPISFSTISGCTFSKRESVDNVIYCEVSTQIGKMERTVQLVFDVNCGSLRERL